MDALAANARRIASGGGQRSLVQRAQTDETSAWQVDSLVVEGQATNLVTLWESMR